MQLTRQARPNRNRPARDLQNYWTERGSRIACRQLWNDRYCP